MHHLLTIGWLCAAWLFSAQPDCQGQRHEGLREGLWKCFYEDGQLQQEGNFVADQKHGSWKLYHTNGQLAAEGRYERDAEKGLWRFYDEDGQVIFENDYGQ